MFAPIMRVKVTFDKFPETGIGPISKVFTTPTLSRPASTGCNEYNPECIRKSRLSTNLMLFIARFTAKCDFPLVRILEPVIQSGPSRFLDIALVNFTFINPQRLGIIRLTWRQSPKAMQVVWAR